MSDEIKRLRAALEEMAAWVKHWEEDRRHNLKPTEGSLADATTTIRKALQ